MAGVPINIKCCPVDRDSTLTRASRRLQKGSNRRAVCPLPQLSGRGIFRKRRLPCSAASGRGVFIRASTGESHYIAKRYANAVNQKMLHPLGRAMRFGSRRLTLTVAILLFLSSPGFAAADCNPPWPSNSRWKLESQNGVWWLATPCGERFLSIGINGLDKKLLAPPPDLRADKSWVSSHLDAHSWAPRTVQRMSAWGFNTVGGFSSSDLPLPSIPELLLGWKSDFLWSDPFDPSAESRVMAAARELVAPYKNAGYRIGYFSDNEIGWWNGALFVFYIQKPETNYSKRKLVDLIRNYYGGNWRRFTADFVVPPAISSFDELLQTVPAETASTSFAVGRTSWQSITTDSSSTRSTRRTGKPLTSATACPSITIPTPFEPWRPTSTWSQRTTTSTVPTAGSRTTISTA